MSASARKSPEEQEAFWQAWLSGEKSPTELPLDMPRMPAPSYYRESASEWIDADATRELQAAAERLETSPGAVLLSAFAALCARYSGSPTVLIGVVAGASGDRGANPLPFELDLEEDPSGAELVRAAMRQLQTLAEHADHPADALAAAAANREALYRLMFRTEGLTLPITDADADTDAGPQGAECDAVLTAAADGDGIELRLEYDADLFEGTTATRLLSALRRALGALSDPAAKLSQWVLLSDAEREQILVDWNDTATEYPQRCIHELVQEQVERTPDAPALAFCSELLSYRELNERANQLAHLLIERGVKPDDMVGLWMERSTELVVSVLAVLKAGAAYVPMDPHYPMERVTHMAVDSGAPLVLTAGEVSGNLDAPSAAILRLEDLADDLAGRPTDNPSTAVRPEHLAYVIYTSGSTGKPKGVMVEHRNVVNFFVGMDEPLETTPGSWLAVTSLSFDISVLELLWTLCRGFKVVLFSTSRQRDEEPSQSAAESPAPSGPTTSMDFDIFYFASDEGSASKPGRERYRLFIEGAKFGDRHGFKGVWSPERHFDTFGGLYPSPAVASGALAMVTENIQIRAGSIVLPLHDNVRVAEELQLVDNLSDGRAGVAFTTGWQPDDFVLAPGSYKERQQVTYDGIELIRSLWKGGTATRSNGVGKDYSFKTLPRPVQEELPIWLTCGGGLPGFVKAGEMGLNVLTHLLGQTIEELETKLDAYRAARKKAGHEGPGYVSLMLHTYVTDDAESVKPTVHEPLKSYLRGSQQLFAGFAKELGIDMNNLTDEDRETLAEHSFQRYFDTSGLFGTPESCKPFVENLARIGVNSIACLIDFGIDTDKVLQSLEHLNVLRQSCQALELGGAASAADAPYSIQGLIRSHAITHLQCTPSMCSMLLTDPDAKSALATVDHLMIGGEAFPRRLASELRELNPTSKITNMYGPTETTIWSSTHPVEPQESEIPIGRPIANTQLYVLDGNRQPVPPGVVGHLYIGGDGVVRGYHAREELTAERFVQDPFAKDASARMYWTGDLARFRHDGVLEFLGRGDNQVKFRGFRIELGEIETALAKAPEVGEAVVLVREDSPGDKRLVAYLVPTKGMKIDVAKLRDGLKGSLTEFMIPTAYVVLDAMPLTPNAKVDRKALPLPDSGAELSSGPYVEPSNELEGKIATIWCEVLKVQRVGTKDSFFDLGGHSVLVVQVLNKLRELGYELAMTDLFQYPTIATLAQFISPDGEQTTAAQAGADRAAARKARMGRRRRGR